MNIILWIIFGAVAGWIADMIARSDHAAVEDIILSIIGAFVGGLLMTTFNQPGITGFNLYSLCIAVIGAVTLIYLGRLLHKSDA